MIDLVRPVAVELDVPVTRRLRVHAVIDGNGVQVHHERDIANIFDWLLEVGCNNASFQDQQHTFDVAFERRPDPPSSKGD